MFKTVVFVFGMVNEGFKILLLKEEMHLKIGEITIYSTKTKQNALSAGKYGFLKPMS